MIIHYAFADNNADILMALLCRKIIVYHNIAPGHFLRDVGQASLANACDAERAYLPRMKDAFEAVVAVSAYNATSLQPAATRRHG
jgi:hypothetical protein